MPDFAKCRPFRISLTLCLIILGSGALALAGGPPPVAGPSLTVDAVDITKAGSLNIHVSIGSQNGDVMVSWPKGVDSNGVAKAIADAINKKFGKGSAQNSGAKVQVQSKNAISIAEVEGIATNPTVSLNSDGFALNNFKLPVVAGILGFEPNPFNGQDTLVTDALVSVGFLTGLAPVSFTAPTGASLPQLASSLDTALLAAGYTSQIVGPDLVEVFANGALSPTELDFGIVPLGNPGDRGIAFSIETVPIPEPSTVLLFVAGALGICAPLLARRARPRRKGRPSECNPQALATAHSPHEGAPS